MSDRKQSNNELPTLKDDNSVKNEAAAISQSAAESTTDGQVENGSKFAEDKNDGDNDDNIKNPEAGVKSEIPTIHDCTNDSIENSDDTREVSEAATNESRSKNDLVSESRDYIWTPATAARQMSASVTEGEKNSSSQSLSIFSTP